MSHSVITKYKITLKGMILVALTLQRSCCSQCVLSMYAWSYSLLTSNQIILIQQHSQVIQGNKT